MNWDRRILALALVALAAAAVIAGCGGSSSSSDNADVSPQLNAALKYLPKDAAVLAVAPTDPNSGPIKQLDQLGSAKVKGWDDLTKKIRDSITENASQQEIDGLLGNPIAYSASGPKSGNANIAIQAQNGATIKQAAQKDIAKGDAKALPEYKGTYVWQDIPKDSSDDDLNFNGLNGNMVFAADTLQLLQRAIDNAGGSDNLSSNNEFKSKLNDLGDGSLLRVVGDAQTLLSNAGNTQSAEKVPFVKSLGIFTANTTVTADGLSQEAVLATDNEDLSDDELPLPTGDATLTLPTADGIAGIAISDPDHIAQFAQLTLKQVNPAGSAQIEQGISQLRATGADLHKDLLSQIEQISVSIMSNNSYEFRADLKDPKHFSDALSSVQLAIQGAIGSLGNGDLTLSLDDSGGQTTYVIERGNTEVARFGVRGNALVGSVGPSADLPSPTQGSDLSGKGAIGIEVLLSKITSLPGAKDQIGDPIAKDVLSSLGKATQTISETTDQITVNSQVTVGSGK